MRVGIIGAGELGLGLARLLVGAGIEVVIAGKADGDALVDLQRDFQQLVRLGALVAAAEPELVILALPWTDIAEAVRPIADWGARTVIDACNRGVGPVGPLASSTVVAGLLPDARVVKAFNALPAGLLEGGRTGAGGRLAVFYSGDHPRPKKYVARLIRQLGFCPIDLGTLAQSRHLQEPGGALFNARLVRLP